MHASIFEYFNKILEKRQARGPFLEVGAMKSPDTLLAVPYLRNVEEKVGVSLDTSDRVTSANGEIRKMDAKDMSEFGDGSFRTVVCNAVLEHEPEFWRVVGEMERVTEKGGLIVLGVPGYGRLWYERLVGHAARVMPAVDSVLSRKANWMVRSTLTYRVHNAPGDYYRFSEQAVREVLLRRCVAVDIGSLLVPPRYIGAGVLD